MKKIFISYSRKSRAQVVTLADDLTLLGYSVWFDKELIGGHNWWEVILENIRFCDVFLFTVASDSLQSTPCQREIAYAQSLNKPIVPVLVDTSINISLLPPSLQAVQFVDYTTPSKETIGKLNRALISLPLTPALPDPLPTPPEMPLSHVAEINKRIAQSHLSTDEQWEIWNAIQQVEAPQDAKILHQRLQQHPDFSIKITDNMPPAPTQTPTATTLYIRRKRGYSYSLRAFQVLLDGVRIGEIRNNETVSFPNISAGHHQLTIKVDMTKTAQTFRVEEGQSAICFDVGLGTFIIGKLMIEEIPYDLLFP
jgi:hypothetical protein